MNGASFTWIANPDTGRLDSWPIEFGRPAWIGALNSDGTYCATGLWPYDAGGILASVGTAITGIDGGGVRFLPDPVTSTCKGQNTRGGAIGQWNGQAYFREIDGGILRFDFFQRPLPRDDFVPVQLSSINERSEIVGYLQTGQFWGRGNPAALWWSEDGGAVLLDNDVRPAVANDIDNAGRIVGAGVNSNSDFVPMLWLDWQARGVELPLPSGFATGEALAISDDGFVVGQGLDSRRERAGLVWFGGRVFLADALIASPVEARDGGWHVSAIVDANGNSRMLGEVAERVDAGGVSAIIYHPVVMDLVGSCL
ncbi:MAG: hypothetical protein HKUEN07_07370 [Rhodocyclaceae bacterium]|nr:MAG: hypothetical protein HKUEN07_07370 [Rhodocyclaceae bacterium]